MKLDFLMVAPLVVIASAQVRMTNPIPYGKSTLKGSALFSDGSNFPCQLRNGVYDDEGAQNIYAQGSTQHLAFMGSAVRGGGSCQVSITSDLQPNKTSIWKVIKSIEGGCPARDQPGNMGDDPNFVVPDTYNFTIPSQLAVGNYTIAWTWFSKLGNRDMFMNCAPITIIESGSSNGSEGSSHDGGEGGSSGSGASSGSGTSEASGGSSGSGGSNGSGGSEGSGSAGSNTSGGSGGSGGSSNSGSSGGSGEPGGSNGSGGSEGSGSSSGMDAPCDTSGSSGGSSNSEGSSSSGSSGGSEASGGTGGSYGSGGSGGTNGSNTTEGSGDSGGSGESGGSDSFFDSLPSMFVANLRDGSACRTVDNTNLLFPEPGAFVEKLNMHDPFALPKSCGSPPPTTHPSSIILQPIEPKLTLTPITRSVLRRRVAQHHRLLKSPAPPTVPSAPAKPMSHPAPGAALPVGASCTNEGSSNCLEGGSFQKCTHGAWTPIMPLALGVECVAGQSSEIQLVQSRRSKHALRDILRRHPHF